ncbi:MAG: SDR family oxidoreductase [Bacteroidota bacterium]|nr:SDR family oxidoreductase [Bacteroidota bacterium]
MKLKGKIVFISGASSGIGEATAKAFAQKGSNLILCARRKEKLDKLANELKKKYKIDIYTFKLDVRDKKAVEKSINEFPEKWKNIDVLVNNAGLSRGLDKLHEGLIQDWEEMIDTNVKGLLYLTRIIVPIMVKNNKGHIINIGSTAGIHAYPGGNVYCATKAAVQFISNGLRQDVVDKAIRVTNIQPGMAETEFSNVRFHGDNKKADSVYKGIKPLLAEDIADIIVYTASVPAHVQICEVTVTPTNQATGGVIYKEGSFK